MTVHISEWDPGLSSIFDGLFLLQMFCYRLERIGLVAECECIACACVDVFVGCAVDNLTRDVFVADCVLYVGVLVLRRLSVKISYATRTTPTVFIIMISSFVP